MSAATTDIFRHLLRLMALVMGLMAVSCSDSSDDAPGADKAAKERQMGFYISVDNGEAAVSRAPGDETQYNPGAGYENYIDIPGSDFRFWFFTDAPGAADKDNRFIAEFTVNGIIPLEGTSTSKTYHVLGSLDREVFDPSAERFKVMVLANWKDYPVPAAGQTIDEIMATAQTLFAGFNPEVYLPTAENPIPLYGIQEYAPLTFSDTNFASLGTIHLLRAYAKVEIDATESSAALASVKIVGYNTAGVKGPRKVYRRADYVKDSWEGDYTKVPTLDASSAPETGRLKFHKIPGEQRYIIYLPEFDNLSDPKAASFIEVTFVGSEDEVKVIKFANYVNNEPKEPFNLMRNWWYRYRVTRSMTEIDVQPYAEQKLRPIFGMMRDESGDIMIIPDKDGNLPENFNQYLETFHKELPEWKMVDGDYYAIVMGEDGLMANSTVWLKDIDGDRVMGNFKDKDETGLSDDCSTRLIWRYTNYKPDPYHKDRDHDLRLQHNTDHTSVVLDPDGVMIFKTPDNATRLKVESFDKESGLFWIRYDGDDRYKYVEMGRDGKATGNEIFLPKEPQEEEKTEP